MSKNISARERIMDISLNLARIGNWTADSYDEKKNLINRFILQTDEYIDEISGNILNKELNSIFQKFIAEFEKLKRESVNRSNKEEWAERALTWANILQHRAKLA